MNINILYTAHNKLNFSKTDCEISQTPNYAGLNCKNPKICHLNSDRFNQNSLFHKGSFIKDSYAGQASAAAIATWNSRIFLMSGNTKLLSCLQMENMEKGKEKEKDKEKEK